ncbi:MAG: bifunctional 3-demethylubiquinone-9 3-methyltransferase/2-octaprenyl-6-hydroxy phenol methylase [Solirubrobacterales bacterium]|nr:bifunctional 3-demethylubiquinone-9 3-methyltransferase/2-octaprenyl-6-hydroxy phenol methylase [Solirubrobacterales bacterium]
MPSREYHEGVWQGVPEGLEPADFALRRRFMLDNVAAGQRVLDVGCGEGRFTAELVRAGAHAVGIDVAEEPLRRARALHPQLDLRLVDGEGAWELPDAGFDVVWAGEVIEHVADTAAWLSEVRRVLCSGGSLLISTPAHGRLALARTALSRRAYAERFDPRGDHLRYYSHATLAALLGNFGFEAITVRGAGGLRAARRLLLARAVRSRF